MTTKLTDVIHFYLGCECMIKYFYEEWYKEILNRTSLSTGTAFKPILRQLDSMAEEERKQLNDSMIFVKATPVHMVGNMQWTPETYRLAFKMGIDLFGLIASGQAIDKNKM